MKNLRFTFIRRAMCDEYAYPINFFEYHRAYFVGLEIVEKFGKVDAIYCSCLSGAIETAKILKIAVDCDIIDQMDVLNDDVSEIKQRKFFDKVKKQANAKGQKHILFVMHEPGIGALIHQGIHELNFFNVNSADVGKTKLHGVEINFLEKLTKKYPEQSAIMLNMLDEQKSGNDGLLNAIKEFHHCQNLEGLICKIRLWKTAFLKTAKIEDLTEDNDWLDIMLHPKCLDFDVFEMLDASFQNAADLTPDEWSQLKHLPWYKTVSDGSNYMFYPEFIELPVWGLMGETVYCRKDIDAKFFKLYMVEAIVSENFAKKMAGFNLLICFPYSRYMCSLSFRTELSEAMVSAKKAHWQG